MALPIPSQQTKKWTQLNSGDIFGNIFASRNLNFDKEGYVTLAKKSSALYREDASSSNFDSVVSIVFAPDSLLGYHIITSDDIFLLTADLDTMTRNTTSGVPTPTLNGDGIYFNSLVLVSAATKVHSWSGAAWAEIITGLTTGVPHFLCSFESLNQLAVGNGNTVGLYNTSWALQTTLTIPAQYQVTWMVYRDSFLYIGTKNLAGGQAKMFVWNGSGTAAQRAFGCGGEWSLSGCEYSNSVATITTLGQVLLFNGGGFDTLGNLPIFYKNKRWYTGVGYANGPVERRGMIGDGDNLFINLCGDISDYPVVTVNQPSGLWCFNPTIGLYHKAGWSSDAIIGTTNSVSSVNTTTDVITLGAAMETQTGDPVLTDGSGGNIGGLASNTVYYAIRVTSTTIKLAYSYSDAIAGTAIDLTSNSGGASILTPKRGDFGNTGFDSMTPGAVALIANLGGEIFDFYGSNILFGAGNIPEDNSEGTTYNTLQSLALGANRGSIITTKIFSDQITDLFQKVLAKVRGLYNSNDKVLVKYKIVERDGLPKVSKTIVTNNDQTVQWQTSSSFMTNSGGTPTGSLGFNVVQVGDEVLIIDGAGAGYTAHITAISGSYNAGAGQMTFTIDEAIPLIANGDKSMVLIDNWVTIGTISTTGDALKKLISLSKVSKWLQLKIEFRGSDNVQLEELQVLNKTQLPTV